MGRIVDALAERDVREALGMFARMLVSGHFNADRVIKIGLGGKPDVGHDLLIKILMRADYRLYSDKSGFIHNIFAPPNKGFNGNILLITEILGFFAQPRRDRHQIGGYRALEELLSDMAGMGFEEGELRDRVHYLIAHKLLAYDGEDNETPNDSDLIKITPSGFIHLRSLPHFVEYIASAALYIPFDDHSISGRVAEIWARVERYPNLNFSFKHSVASMVGDYLTRHKNSLDAKNPLFRERSREAERIVVDVTRAVNTTLAAANRQKSRVMEFAKLKKER